MLRKGPIVGSVLLLGVAGAAFAVAAGPSQAKAPKSEPSALKSVRVADVAHRSLSRPIRATGTVHAKREVELSFLIGGEVTWVGADVGAVVHRGQVLARIDATQMAADTERARAAALKSQRDLERVTALRKSDALPQANLDDAETADRIARAQRHSAEFALRHGVLIAPDDGIIDARQVDPGEVVAAGRPVFRLSGKARGAVVRVALSDHDIVGLEVGRGAVVVVDALGDETYTAKISQVAAAASPGSGTFEVELRLDNAPERLKNGMTAKIEIQRMTQPGSVVPVSALTPSDTGPASVVAVDNAVAHRFPVHVLFLEGTEVALLETLPGVISVATEGSASLTEGLTVKVAKP